MSTLGAADWGVVALYAAIVVGLGARARRRQQNTDEYFLGGRGLPWPLVGASILATAFSATSLLGAPGEAFQHGLLWLQLQAGDALAILVVLLVFIPFFRGLSLRTAYEYLERRFDPTARALASVVFQLQVLLRTGVLLYGPALALATITGLDVKLAIVVVGGVAMGYTLLGGITAVIWTDVLQLVVVVVGLGLTAAIAVSATPGGFAGAWETAAAAGRTRLVDLELPWTSVRSVLGAVVGYGVLSLSVAGTNQQPVQRYLSCRSVGEAQRAAVLGWFVGLVVTVLTLLVGLLLYSYYQAHAADLPADSRPDEVFPYFIATRLPVGVAGLLVAAIFAAAMSSLDSALNSLATASVVDVYERFVRPGAEDAVYLRAAHRATIVWGLLAIAAALYVAGRGTLLNQAVRYMNYFAGPLLGLFLLGVGTRRATARGAVTGMVTAYVVTLVLAISEATFGWTPPVGGIWLTTVGCAVTLLVGYGVSLTQSAPRPDQLRGLTLRDKVHDGGA